MTLYGRFLEYQSDPETLIRWGAYIFILIGFLNALTANFLALNNLLDISSVTALTDANADLGQEILVLNLWNFIVAFLKPLLFGVGALAFLKIATDEDLLIWLRMIAYIAIVVLLFGSFLF